MFPSLTLQIPMNVAMTATVIATHALSCDFLRSCSLRSLDSSSSPLAFSAYSIGSTSIVRHLPATTTPMVRQERAPMPGKYSHQIRLFNTGIFACLPLDCPLSCLHRPTAGAGREGRRSGEDPGPRLRG